MHARRNSRWCCLYALAFLLSSVHTSFLISFLYLCFPCYVSVLLSHSAEECTVVAGSSSPLFPFFQFFHSLPPLFSFIRTLLRLLSSRSLFSYTYLAQACTLPEKYAGLSALTSICRSLSCLRLCHFCVAFTLPAVPFSLPSPGLCRYPAQACHTPAREARRRYSPYLFGFRSLCLSSFLLCPRFLSLSFFFQVCPSLSVYFLSPCCLLCSRTAI